VHHLRWVAERDGRGRVNVCSSEKGMRRALWRPLVVFILSYKTRCSVCGNHSMYRHTNDYPAASHQSLSAVTEWRVLMSVAMVLKKTCKTRENVYSDLR
jgi:hypothetical protein